MKTENHHRIRRMVSLALVTASVGLLAVVCWLKEIDVRTPKTQPMLPATDIIVWKKFSAFMLQHPQANISQVMDALNIKRKSAYHLLNSYAETAEHSGPESMYATVVAKYTATEVQRAQQYVSANVANSMATGFCAPMLAAWQANLQVLNAELKARALSPLPAITLTTTTRCTPKRLRRAA